MLLKMRCIPDILMFFLNIKTCHYFSFISCLAEDSQPKRECSFPTR